jgi:spore coat polysaccharide biosynthesis protein SpsF
MKIIAITQARLGSTRLPNKVMLNVKNQTLLSLHLARILKSKKINKLILATTFEEGIQALIDEANVLGVQSYLGSLEDVLDRFYQAALPEKPDYVVRLTSDCPLIDPVLLDSVIEHVIESGADYGSNTLIESFPDGQDVEVFKFSALERAWKEAILSSEREHVTPFIWKNTDFKGGNIFAGTVYKSEENFGGIRLTVDNQFDLECIQTLVNELGTENSYDQYARFILENPELFFNQNTIRNEGYAKSIQKD